MYKKMRQDYLDSFYAYRDNVLDQVADGNKRAELKKDFDIQREQMVADLLAQCSTLQLEARKKGQYHIALGAINTAAKLASLCS